MVNQDNKIPQDVVVQLHSDDGAERFLAITEASRSGLDLVGKHLGEIFSVPLSDIKSIVSIATGLEFGPDSL